MSDHWGTTEDLTFEMALARFSDRVFHEPEEMALRMASAIGLAFGMAPQDVILCATADAAIAKHADQQLRDYWLSHYPKFCRGHGANYDEK